MIGHASNDFDGAVSTMTQGVRVLNTVLAAQGEESGVQTAEAWVRESEAEIFTPAFLYGLGRGLCVCVFFFSSFMVFGLFDP